jgi:hypothetical protein
MKNCGRLLTREEMLPIVKEEAFAEIRHVSRLRDLDKEYFAMVLPSNRGHPLTFLAK